MKDVIINPDEDIVDLERNGYKLIQKKEGFRFGMDAVLLSGFANVSEGEKTIDLGTGTGIIPILLKAKTEGTDFIGLEIQEESVELAKRNVEMNELSDFIEINQGDIKEASNNFGAATFDVVVTNPPYMTEDGGITNPNDAKAIARHEIKCNLEDVIRESAKLLKPMGRFYMVHRPRRMPDLIELMRKYGIEPKVIRMVHPFAEKPANMVLIEGVRGGRAMTVVEKPLIVYKEPDIYTDEIYDIYGF